jgi:DNA-3-methyladenine glycosylase II
MNMNKNLLAAKHLSKNDKLLSTIIKSNGIRNLTSNNKYFNSLLDAIIGQQLSIAAAATIRKRFYAFLNNKPTPELIIESHDSNLRACGLSNAKVKYVKDLALKVVSKEISLRNFSKKSDEEVIELLTKVKGVGIWTAHMFLMFTLGRENVLPVGDLGIRKAIMLIYKLPEMPNELTVQKVAAKNNWHPFCSHASLYLWSYLDNSPKL